MNPTSTSGKAGSGHTREIETDLYSDAMDSAVNAFCTARYLLRDAPLGATNENRIRGQIAAAIRAFLEEYPGESGLVRLARPPAPFRNGTTVGVQPAAQLSTPTGDAHEP